MLKAESLQLKAKPCEFNKRFFTRRLDKLIYNKKIKQVTLFCYAYIRKSIFYFFCYMNSVSKRKLEWIKTKSFTIIKRLSVFKFKHV